MLRLLIAFILCALPACASITNLPPETAAKRISNSDGYKEEACQFAQDYVNVLNSYSWDSPGKPLVVNDEEIKHLVATFAFSPAVDCRVKSGRYFYDIDGRSIYYIMTAVRDVVAITKTLEQENTTVINCRGCEFPDIPLSNGLLLEYFKRAPFPLIKRSHEARFRKACMEDPAATSLAHAHHGRRPGLINAGYEFHDSCDDALKAILKDQETMCSRFGTMPYLICPNGVWSTAQKPARPLHYHDETYQSLDSFKGGFYLTFANGVDVYWRTSAQTLSHEMVPAARGKLIDADGDGRTDLQAGDALFLSKSDGTATRTTMTAFNANERSREEAQIVEQARVNPTLLPLEMLERLLATTHANDRELMEIAADKSYEWWGASQDSSMLERAQVYWHARLWNELTQTNDLGSVFWQALVEKVKPRNSADRRTRLQKARSAGEAQVVFDECKALRGEMQSILANLDAAKQGTAVAVNEIGPAWELYHRSKIPLDQVNRAHAAAQQNAAEQEAFLQKVCL